MARLRANELAALVSGPFVVLDMDAGTFTTLCDKAARDAAQDLSAKLADPTRPAPICIKGATAAGPTVICTQVDAGEIVAVVLSPPEQPQVTGALFGRKGPNYNLVRDLGDHIATASCP